MGLSTRPKLFVVILSVSTVHDVDVEEAPRQSCGPEHAGLLRSTCHISTSVGAVLIIVWVLLYGGRELAALSPKDVNRLVCLENWLGANRSTA